MSDVLIAPEPVSETLQKPTRNSAANATLQSRAMRHTRSAIDEWKIALPFLLPSLAGICLFTMLPLMASALLSLTEWDLLTSPRFVGLDNYRNLLGISHASGMWQASDPDFWKYLWNTIYLMAALPIGIAGSLILAMLLNRRVYGYKLLRSIYFLPSMCVPVAVFLLWRWLYNADHGLINWALGQMGIQGPEWVNRSAWAKPAIMLAGLWAGLGGYNMVFYLAALQNIPTELYEAAILDGASPRQKFIHITIPLLAPTTYFITATSIIGGFQGGFDAAFVITAGGPAGATTTLMYYIYNNAFEWSKMGYAACISWVLFTLVFVATWTHWKLGGRHADQLH